ncbi:MAG: hypothetical protein ACU836_08960 [Gammaproteobacteria bacterium]
MSTELKKNRITILAIFALSVIPFGIAWFLAQHPDRIKLGTNHGELISPPIASELSDFLGADAFSADNIGELKGHWIMVNIISGQTCDQACRDGLYKTQQVSLMMGKDIARIRRLALMLGRAIDALPNEWQEDARLLKAQPSVVLKENLSKIDGYAVPGGLLIMDPFGNLMMKYAPGYDPYKVKSDLSKLLRISQIG